MEKNSLIRHPLITQLLEHYRTIWSLNHMTSLAHWDMETYMPEEGAEARAEALSKVAVLSQKLFLEPVFVALIHKGLELPDLNVTEKAILRLLSRSLKMYQKLPPVFIEEWTRVTNEAHGIWKKAREENNFNLFAPKLEEIFYLARKRAEFLGYEEHPYDALLDEFEEGLTVKEVTEYFSLIKTPIITLLKKIRQSPSYKGESALAHIGYETNKMHALTMNILSYLHYNMSHLRLDVSTHPFTSAIGKGDKRITTRYEGKDFAKSWGSTIHEYGHALYDLQTHEDLHFTPIGEGTSLIIHESQSRFWENFVGRSFSFLKHFHSDLIDAVPELKNFSINDLHLHLNHVKPGFIRVEADELTYHLHVLIRFEIEKALLEKSINVNDVPGIWKKKFKEYLGVDVEKDRDGALQDVHWSEGYIGYFPTYSLGTALSAMWKHKLEKHLGKIDDLSGSQEGIRKIQGWLKEHIHQYGSTYTFGELVKKSSGEEFTAKYLLDYLEDKFGKMYKV